MLVRNAIGAMLGVMLMTQAAWGADVATANNAMGLDLLRHLDPAAKKNAFISPFSISEALTLTANGARSATLDSMRAALKLKQMSLGDANAEYKKLGDQFAKSGKLNVANGLFVQKSFPLQKPFLDIASQQYGATVESVDFKAKAAEPVINQWVSNKTNKKIPSIVQNLPEATRLVIANAVYFKAPWVHAFAEGATQPAAFHVTAGDTIQIPAMHNNEHFSYAKLDNAEVVELPYRESTVAMDVFLPAKSSSVEAVLKGMNETWWQKFLKSMQSSQVAIQLPKFKIEYSTSLKNALMKMGMENAFTTQADFSGIAKNPGEPLSISDVLHKTYLDVNEKGTEAAAATAVIMVATAARMPETPIPFVVDRPFIVAIRDTASGAILFIGVIRDPRK
jgi:serpin B